MSEDPDSSIVSDAELAALPIDRAKALFALNEANGAGDYELTAVPQGDAGDAYVASYDAAIPEWPPAVLAAVQEQIRSLTDGDVRRLTGDLHGSPGERATYLEREALRIDQQIDEAFRLTRARSLREP
jgi:hypothetical protein